MSIPSIPVQASSAKEAREQLLEKLMELIKARDITIGEIHGSFSILDVKTRKQFDLLAKNPHDVRLRIGSHVSLYLHSLSPSGWNVLEGKDLLVNFKVLKESLERDIVCDLYSWHG